MSSSTAYVLYDNVLTRANVTAPNTLSGSDIRSAFDYRTSTYWTINAGGWQFINFSTASAVTLDCLAVARHNLGSAGGGHINLDVWNGTDWVNCAHQDGIADNQCVFLQFAPQTSNQWRVSVNVTGVLSIGVLSIGQALLLPHGMPMGFVPPRHDRQQVTVPNKTEGGQFVGRSVVNKGLKTTLSQPTMPSDWLRQFGEAWIRHAELLPFFFSWSAVRYPQDAVYCWADNITPASTISLRHQSLTMNLYAVGGN